MVVSESGDVISYQQDDPTVLVFDRTGNLRRSWESGLTETHGMTLVTEGDSEYLWTADNGRKRQSGHGYEYPDSSLGPVSVRVVKTALNGQTIMELQRPDLAVYAEGQLCAYSGSGSTRNAMVVTVRYG